MSTEAIPTLLGDGRSVTCRPACSGDQGDADAVLALYGGLSEGSRFTRFCQATPRLTASLRQTLVDFDRGPLWLAWHDGRCVGEARLVGSRHGRGAHLAVTVADEFQGVGLGGKLCRYLLTDDARDDDGVTVSMLPSNRAAVRLARRRGLQLRLVDGVFEARIAPRHHDPYPSVLSALPASWASVTPSVRTTRLVG